MSSSFEKSCSTALESQGVCDQEADVQDRKTQGSAIGLTQCMCVCVGGEVSGSSIALGHGVGQVLGIS